MRKAYKILTAGIVLAFLCVSIPAAYASFAVQKVVGGGTLTPEYLDLKLAPGISETHYVAVRNDGTEEQNYEIRTLDAASWNDETGAFVLQDRGIEQVGVGKWGVLAENNFAILGGEYKVIPVIFTIPEDATLGVYWGGVVATESKVANSGESVILAQVALRARVEIVPMDQYVPQEEEKPAILDQETEGKSIALPYYIAAAVIILVAAVAIGMVAKKDKKKKK